MTRTTLLLLILPSLLVSALGAVPRTGASDPGDVEQVAKAYLAAYEARDLETLTEFLHPDVVYEDPTASLLGVELHVEGRAEVVGMLAPMFEGTADLSLEIERQFFSGDQTDDEDGDD
jgi:ketosteroid isomerase-like protein